MLRTFRLFEPSHSVRFREKRTFRARPEKPTILILNNLSRTTALPPEPAVKLISSLMAANDPKRSFLQRQESANTRHSLTAHCPRDLLLECSCRRRHNLSYRARIAYRGSGLPNCCDSRDFLITPLSCWLQSWLFPPRMRSSIPAAMDYVRPFTAPIAVAVWRHLARDTQPAYTFA